MNKKIRKLNKKEKDLIINYLFSINLEFKKINCIIHNLIVLEISGGSHKDVFLPSKTQLDFLLKYNFIEKIYSLGLYFGLIGRSGFEPSLPLAREFAPLCSKECSLNCIFLSENSMKKFLYGKQVLIRESDLSCVESGNVLVVSHAREPLGWGVVRRLQNKYGHSGLLLTPVKDLGWYLRRGG